VTILRWAVGGRVRFRGTARTDRQRGPVHAEELG
jgi:hypothetical protein